MGNGDFRDYMQEGDNLAVLRDAFLFRLMSEDLCVVREGIENAGHCPVSFLVVK